MLRTSLGALMSALTFLYAGVYIFGTMRPGEMVPYIAASHDIHNVRVIDRVTPEGSKAGLRSGDRLDYARLTPPDRYRLNMWGGYQVASGESFTVPYFRHGHPIFITHYARPAPRDQWVANYVTDFLLLFLAAFGSLLIIRGSGASSFWSGMFFLSSAYGLPYSYGGIVGLPGTGNIIVVAVSIFLGALVPIALYIFAETMLAPDTRAVTRWTFRLLCAPGILSNTYVLAYGLIFLFTGDEFGWSIFANFVGAAPIVVEFLVVIYMLCLAMLQRGQPQPTAARIIFWSTLIGLSGAIFDVSSEALGHGLPFDAELSLTIVVMPIGIAYAVFSKRLYDIEFFVSRGVIYGLVLAFVVAVIALMESVIESTVLGQIGGVIVAVIVPIALGFSMRWIERRVGKLVATVLFREKARAHADVRALIDDLTEAHDADALVMRAVREIYRAFNSACIVYLYDGDSYHPRAAAGTQDTHLMPIPQDDPAFMRLRRTRRPVDTRDLETAMPFRGFMFPLAVFGRISGALLIAQRPHQQSYDPDDQALLEHFARELGIALLYLRDETPSTRFFLPASS